MESSKHDHVKFTMVGGVGALISALNTALLGWRKDACDVLDQKDKTKKADLVQRENDVLRREREY